MLKLNAGISRKVGEEHFGSRGASVNLELEVESGLVNDPDGLMDRIRRLFSLARDAVDQEVERERRVGRDPLAHDRDRELGVVADEDRVRPRDADDGRGGFFPIEVVFFQSR